MTQEVRGRDSTSTAKRANGLTSVLMFAAVGLIPVSYAISGAVAQWSLAWLFAGAGVILTVTSAAATSAKAARELD